METPQWAMRIAGGVLLLFLGDNYRARLKMPEKYVSKADCQRIYDQIHNDNRNDFQEVFKQLREVRADMAKNQTMILRELAKK